MSLELNKLEPWQIFHVARKNLGPGLIAKVFGKANVRSAYDWSQNPFTTQKRCRSPLEALHHLFQLLDDIGLGYVARSAIAYLQTALDPEDLEPVQEPLPTMQEEILADYSAVARLQESIERCDPVEVVEKRKKDAHDELDRTYAKYLQDCR